MGDWREELRKPGRSLLKKVVKSNFQHVTKMALQHCKMFCIPLNEKYMPAKLH